MKRFYDSTLIEAIIQGTVNIYFIRDDGSVYSLANGRDCAPSEGASITAENSKWQQTPFNGDYASSIFISQDPVAIDSVGADFLPAYTKQFYRRDRHLPSNLPADCKCPFPILSATGAGLLLPAGAWYFH